MKRRLLVLGLGLVLLSCTPRAIPPTEERLFAFQSTTHRLVEFLDLAPLATFDLPLPAECTVIRLEAAPVGERLALEVSCPAGPHVLRWDARQKQLHDATFTLAQDAHFLAWSGNGKAVYLRLDSLANPRLVRWEWDGQIQPLALPPFTYHLDEAQDGRLLFLLTQGVGWGSELYQVRAGHIERLLQDQRHILSFARWSPRGDAIVAIRFPDTTTPFPLGELVLFQAPTWQPQVLSRADAGHGFAPAWSAEGDQIVFVQRENPDDPAVTLNAAALQSNLWLAERKGGSVRPLTHFTQARVGSPQVSWDGTRIAFTVNIQGKDLIGITDWSGAQVSLLEVSGICCVGWVR